MLSRNPSVDKRVLRNEREAIVLEISRPSDNKEPAGMFIRNEAARELLQGGRQQIGNERRIGWQFSIEQRRLLECGILFK